MGVNWTAAQRSAIELHGGSVLVSAAAGSGKTAVLVERAVRLITGVNAFPADKMLIITFTKAAAAELKSRLYGAVDALCALHPADTALRRQSVLVRRAEIGTIDSFCQRVVRENFQNTGLPADFRIGADAALRALRAQAMQQTLDELYAESGDFARFSSFFGRARSDLDTERLLYAFYDFLSTSVSPEQYERHARAQLTLPPRETAMYEYCVQRAKKLLRSGITVLERAAQLCAADERLQKGYELSIKDANAQLRTVFDLLTQGNYRMAKTAAQDFAFASFKPVRGVDEDQKAAIMALRDFVKIKLAPDIVSCFALDAQTRSETDLDISAPLESLFAAVKLFEQNLSALKQRARIYDHADIERSALKLLTEENGQPTELARELSQRYEQVMIDEYQDTNGIQNAIFRAVARESMSDAFAVGDVKQSIYSFRNAEPEIFLKSAAECHTPDSGLYPCIVRLNENFRSAPEVTNGVNAVFDKLMTADTCGVEYRKSERLSPCAEQHTCDGVGFELTVLDADSDKDVSAQAKYVCNEIKRLVSSGFTVTRAGITRPCGWGDFAVLLRSAKERAPIFKAELEKAGVPVYSETQGSFFEYDEVNVLLSALEAINNPRREVMLAALLTDRHFDFSAGELLELRRTDKKAGLYALLLHNRENSEKAAKVLDFLHRYRAMAGGTPVDELVRAVENELQTGLYASAGPGGEKRLEAVWAFAEFCAEAARSGCSLSGLIKLARQAQQAGGGSAGSAATVEDAVIITTIHKSKGLEWPIVFVPDLQKGFNTQDLVRPLLFSRTLGVGARIILDGEDASRQRTDTPLYSAVKAELTEKLAEEEMRVLYVAMTRAREKLIAVATKKNAPKAVAQSAALQIDGAPEAEYLKSCKNPLDWVLAALFSGGYFPDDADSGEYIKDGVAVRFVSDTRESALPTEAAAAAADELEAMAAAKLLEWRYPAADMCAIPAKISVSRLTETHASPLPQPPDFALENEPTGAMRGTALHEFMQFADYSAAEKSVQQELERLQKGGYILPQTARITDVSALETLFAHEFMRRILQCPCVKREYEFFYMLPAGQAFPGATNKDAAVLVQGIADCVCVYSDHAVIVDYKSDRVRNEAPLIARYSAQLEVYARAISARLGLPVSEMYLWSFALSKAVKLR